MPTLSKANQEKAARKMVINGTVAVVLWVAASVLAGIRGDLTMWLSILAGHGADLAVVAAFVWPLYLHVLEERERHERPVRGSEKTGAD